MVKTLLTLLTMCFCLSSFANVTENEEEDIKIEVIEEDEDEKVKSLFIPLNATIEGRQLTVTAWVAIEDMTIAIMGEDGIVETRTVSMASNQVEVFNLIDCTDGMYSITFTTAMGMHLFGEFHIDN